jgi:hypothetical protein
LVLAAVVILVVVALLFGVLPRDLLRRRLRQRGGVLRFGSRARGRRGPANESPTPVAEPPDEASPGDAPAAMPVDRPAAAGVGQQQPAYSVGPGDLTPELPDATEAELETTFKQGRVRALEERDAQAAALQRKLAEQRAAVKAREAELRAQHEQALRDAGEAVRRLEVALERGSERSKMLAPELETRWAPANGDLDAEAADPARAKGRPDGDVARPVGATPAVESPLERSPERMRLRFPGLAAAVAPQTTKEGEGPNLRRRSRVAFAVIGTVTTRLLIRGARSRR